jgi:kynurenine formamidase
LNQTTFCHLFGGLFNVIDKPTHFDKHTGNISLLDPILITDSIQVIDSDTIEIDRQISDHDGTYVTFKCGFSNRRDSRRKFESNHILSSVRIVTSLVGIHSLAIVKKASVKFEQALLTSKNSTNNNVIELIT